MDPSIFVNTFTPSTFQVIKALLSTAEKSVEEKRNYVEKLEKASGTDVYKYVLLINISALEGYVAQARLQAQQSFSMSKLVALTGFFIVAIAIALSVYLTMTGNQNLSAAYLAGIAGVITEFIAGVFFFLYSKSLSQINLFHEKLVDMQKTALNYISESVDQGSEAKMDSLSETLKNVVKANNSIQPTADTPAD